MIERELNKWQIILYLKNSLECVLRKKIFRFGIFNIHTFPENDEKFNKKHYKGFIIEWKFLHPLTYLRHYLENKGF